MVGGGEGAFIGAVHRLAARFDDRFELVAGALSSDPGRALSSADAMGLPSERSYTDFREMARAEAARADGVEVVAIVTPNHLHRDVAVAFLDTGVHVICDKPLSLTVPEAADIAAAAARNDRAVVVTYGFSGYPMVRAARELVREGALGAVRSVQIEYAQDWLALAPDAPPDTALGGWRVDPARGGSGGCLGDIGTHAFHMAEFVVGSAVQSVSAEVRISSPGRQVPDEARVALEWADGAFGSLWVSQIAIGNRNALSFRVFGDRASVGWHQERPERLEYARLGEATRTLVRGDPSAGAAAARASRVPAGHPEGYLEAFAQLYREASDLLSAWPDRPPGDTVADLPGLREGVRGMQFIEAALESDRSGAARIALPSTP